MVDNLLFVKKSARGIIIIVVLVDDIIITKNDQEEIVKSKISLKKYFEIKYLRKM